MKLLFEDYCEGCKQIEAVGSVSSQCEYDWRTKTEKVISIETVLTCRNHSRCRYLSRRPVLFRKPLYVCDPEKATTCRKSFCVSKRLADESCWATQNKEWAKLDQDGKPIIPTPCKSWGVYAEGEL